MSIRLEALNTGESSVWLIERSTGNSYLIKEARNGVQIYLENQKDYNSRLVTKDEIESEYLPAKVT